jgi:hypothetical protein
MRYRRRMVGRRTWGTAAALALLTVLAGGCGGGTEASTAERSTAATVEKAPYYPRAEPPVASASVAPRPPQAKPTSVIPVKLARARPTAAPTRAVATSRCASTPVRPLRTKALAFAAVVRTQARVYASPDGRSLARYGRVNVNGVPTVFGVLSRADCGGRWLRVQLPSRPNGILGWVRARDVQMIRVRTRIEVDLSARRVTLYRKGRELISARAAIGASDTPTPTGSYYVNQRLVAPNPSGPYGPAAIGVSAFSPVLQHWIQGGPIAIHGTNQPHLLGGAVSHGCIRIANSAITRMFRLAVAGTPVVIRA